MNSIIDVRADPYTNINTDHRSIEIKIRQKLKAREKPNSEQSLKGIKPEKEGMTNEDAIREYSENLGNWWKELGGQRRQRTPVFQTRERCSKTRFQQAKRKGKETSL